MFIQQLVAGSIMGAEVPTALGCGWTKIPWEILGFGHAHEKDASCDQITTASSHSEQQLGVTGHLADLQIRDPTAGCNQYRRESWNY